MNHKKFITCQQCCYFPNKADEIKQREIKIEPWQIKWRCTACGQENVYAGREVIILPDTSMVTVGKESILTASLYPKKIVQIIVDLDSFLPAQLYYIPVCKEQIAKCCNISIDCFRALQDLQKESQWLTLYLSFLKGFNKFSKKTAILKEQLRQLQYIIYLLDMYTHLLWSKKQGQELKISIISKEVVYSFNINTIDKDNIKIFSFLKIYALLQYQESLPWLLNFYKKELQDHKKIKTSGSEVSHLILVGNIFSQDQNPFKYIPLENEPAFDCETLRCAKEKTILKSSVSFGNNNVFSINSLGKNPFVHYITKSKSEGHRAIFVDFFTVFFRLDKQRNILSMSIDQTEIQVIRRELLLAHNIGKSHQNWLKKELKKLILFKHPNSKVKLIKFYSQLSINSEIKCYLFTFNWAKIEKQLLIEELDEQMEEQHQLKEDILRQDYIKLVAPSPFLKKDRQYFGQERHQKPVEQEDYEYL